MRQALELSSTMVEQSVDLSLDLTLVLMIFSWASHGYRLVLVVTKKKTIIVDMGRLIYY